MSPVVPQPGTSRASGDDVEAEQVDVEAAHAVDVGRAQVDVADGDARVDRAWAAGDRGNVALRTLR